MISGLILPRLFITYYDSDVYGLISSITNFLGFITILDLGIGAVIVANFYKPLEEKNTNKISEIYKFAKKILQ